MVSEDGEIIFLMHFVHVFLLQVLKITPKFFPQAPPQHDATPVKVDLYYEFLCPYCHDYFLHQLYPTYNELKDIMDVSLYPFGNALVSTKKRMLCW